MPNGDLQYRVAEPPPLHPGQLEVWRAYFSGKYRVFCINAGRRFGKSTCCEAIAIEEAANNGKTVWWISPTYKVLEEQWGEMKEILKDVYTTKNEVAHRLEFKYTLPDGSFRWGKIMFRSADKPNNLRGSGIDLLIIDEAAFQDLEVWKVVRPSIVDKKGKVIFISTPNGHNWFFTFFQRGKPENRILDPRYSKWWSRHFTSYDNPYLDPAEIDMAKNDMTETEFRVEHLAEFIDDIGKVFTNVHACATSLPRNDVDKTHDYTIGIDLARKYDATVASVFDNTTHRQVAIHRFIGLDWSLQKTKLASIINHWSPSKVYIDATAVGGPVVEDLQLLVKVTINVFIMTWTSKPPLIQNLAIKFQNKEIEILTGDDEVGAVQIEELLAYEVTMSGDPSSVRYKYGAPRGGKDDTVIALALSIQNYITGKKAMMFVKNNPFFQPTQPKKEIQRKHLSEHEQRANEWKEKLLREAGLL